MNSIPSKQPPIGLMIPSVHLVVHDLKCTQATKELFIIIFLHSVRLWHFPLCCAIFYRPFKICLLHSAGASQYPDYWILVLSKAIHFELLQYIHWNCSYNSTTFPILWSLLQMPEQKGSFSLTRSSQANHQALARFLRYMFLRLWKFRYPSRILVRRWIRQPASSCFSGSNQFRALCWHSHWSRSEYRRTCSFPFLLVF